jgi:hypothetical protein
MYVSTANMIDREGAAWMIEASSDSCLIDAKQALTVHRVQSNPNFVGKF